MPPLAFPYLDHFSRLRPPFLERLALSVWYPLVSTQLNITRSYHSFQPIPTHFLNVKLFPGLSVCSLLIPFGASALF